MACVIENPRWIFLPGRFVSDATFIVTLYNISAVLHKGGNMANLTNALQELRAERSRAQLQVEKLDQAISAIESLNGSGPSRNGTEPGRVISAASRRKMALAQKARWAKVRKQAQQPGNSAKSTASAPTAPVRRTMSAAARKKIAAVQRARWAKIRAEQKKAA